MPMLLFFFVHYKLVKLKLSRGSGKQPAKLWLHMMNVESDRDKVMQPRSLGVDCTYRFKIKSGYSRRKSCC